MSITVHPGSTSPTISKTNDVEWRYEMRRDCQEIFPGLLLGPFQASKDLDKMRALGITHVACIRDVKEAFSVKPRFPDQLHYLASWLKSVLMSYLSPRFNRAKAFIDNALQSGGRVLVHCNGGISLSPSFVIMYVMERFQLAWDDALQMVQNKRYCISPNNGFITQIKEYESIYKAQRTVQSAPGAARPAQTRRKREDDDDEAEESDTRRRPEPTEMQQKDVDMT
ncbi:unnamed protein product [Rhizoctonia solani]|uniref:Uncharacterized protein n=1 Tax=Rhizoctonia solani TaxID=456999 RepID=A0A8H3AAW9_9AGAM|nr:unnamed protein product [Rhizoctonia solani]